MREDPTFRYGADYYPEQWPEARWAEDARMMRDAGFNAVRLAEFAWARMEPEEGRFDFAWLDRAIAILSAQGIRVVLGTPTASPPPWLMADRADLFRVEANGVRKSYGLRREYCPNHPAYRDHAARIVTRMAEHYADDPAVIGWQVDNEFGDRCYCELCRKRFQEWLRIRHGSLQALNERWGTVFWSHLYSDWSQIPLPMETAGTPNPGLALDYRRFMSDSYREFQKLQVDILRRICPRHSITHNLMGFGFGQLDYFDLAADLDHVSWDLYPRNQWSLRAAVDPADAALGGDAMRGLRRGNTWVMEQQSGGGGWEMVAVPPKPGEIRLWTYQSIAHGADGILHFRWRTASAGAEQFWQGILESHGLPGRRYDEAARIGRELRRIGPRIAGSRTAARMAIVHSYDARFAFQIQPCNPRFRYEDHVRDLYRGFHGLGVTIDVVSDRAPLDGYALVVVPALCIVRPETAESLERFAEDGGTVLFTFRTGFKDESNRLMETKLPGRVAAMCGCEVEEYVSMPLDQDNGVRFEPPGSEAEYRTTAWAEVLDPKGAEAIAWHTGDYYAGKPAATVHRHGKGSVVYLGVQGEPSLYAMLAERLLGLAGIEPALDGPNGLEVTERWKDGIPLRFVLNHSDRARTFRLTSPHRDLIEGRRHSGDVDIEPLGVRILEPLDAEEA